MRIKIGEKIRALRHRDGRTQEDLADALGVSCQAVSRWEANGGYPDMEIMPSIANYFHVTIDELFGYNGDREEKIGRILAEADAAIVKQTDIESCVAMLREAVDEFPSEAQLHLRLGYALTIYAVQQNSIRADKSNETQYTQLDFKKNAENELLCEALSTLEKVLEMEISADDRNAVLLNIVIQMAAMGNTEKAKEYANKQAPLFACREFMLMWAADGEERDKYQGEAILALLERLKDTLLAAINSKLAFRSTEGAVTILREIIHLYEAIFEDGRCGRMHDVLRDLYMWCAVWEAKRDNLAEALECFDRAFTHYKMYESLRQSDEYRYTASLVSKVVISGKAHPKTMEAAWTHFIQESFPENLREAIKADARYAECFQ